MTDDDDTIPTQLVIRRLTRDLTERDRLLDLLAQVETGYRLTNRMGEALLIVPEQVMADIRQVLGVAPPEDTPPTEAPA